jgi:hypothetical protein
MAANKEIRVEIWKKLKLDNVKEAIEALSAKERDGRILFGDNISQKYHSFVFSFGLSENEKNTIEHAQE